MAAKFSAYSPVTMTDGLRTWTEHRFDMTKPMTAADLEMLRRVKDVGTPAARIAEMAAQVDALTDASPAIAMHAAAIRAICKQVLRHLGRLRRQDLDALKEADDLWLRIMVLRDVVPAARKGVEADAARARRKVRGLVEMDRSPEWAAKVRATVKANPSMSGRKLARLAGCSEATVRRYRSRR